jgi:UDP-N-acetylmuramoylalanine--D-glutamate ligase
MSASALMMPSTHRATTVWPRSALVVGLGKSGYSAVRFLLARGVRVAATDSRAEPPELPKLAGLPVRVHCGGFDASLLDEAELVVLSPGVAPRGAFFDQVRARGLPLIGDIELFARAVQAPVVAITGTNGKSTVTALLGAMATHAGRRTRIGGNLGTPALELLDEAAELYVLELSSFQLESTLHLPLVAGAVLNVTPDHLDRYADLEAYAAAKARLYAQCEWPVVNLDDARVAAMLPAARRRLSFSLDATRGADYALSGSGSETQLLCRGERLIELSALKLSGRHNAANALAALALAEALALPRAACLEVLREFAGLPHRTQWVAERAGVRYIDDSKGTNVGATLAAVAGFTQPLVLIAGGDGKGQDFAPLRAAFAGKVRAVLLIGRDARRLGTVLEGVCACQYCDSLEAAVAAAARRAQPGDIVLLSPACASLDMFRDYAERGERFAQAVQRLAP